MQLSKPDPYDFDALLAFHKAHFGDAVMTTPTDTSTVSDTTGGVLVGTDPKTPTTASNATFTPVTGTNGNLTTVTSTSGPVFTAEQIAKARQEEKDKLYPQLQTMQAELAELKKARDEKLEEERQAREAAEAAAEEARKADTDTRTLLEEQERRFQEELSRRDAEAAERDRLFQMEKQFQELVAYKERAIAATADDIIPQLAEELRATQHTSVEEIDAHIGRLKTTSASILEQMQAAVQQQRAGMRGAPITAPPPITTDTHSANDPAWEAANNGSLTFEDYLKNRDKLIGAAAQQSRQRGLYG